MSESRFSLPPERDEGELEPATGDVPPEGLERCLGMFEDYCT